MSFFPRRRLGFGVAPEDLYSRPKQKKFNYSNEANFRVIERGISDLASVGDTNSSAIIESILIDKLMPENEDARKYYSAVLFGEKYPSFNAQPTKYDIQDALEDIFIHESAGYDFQSKHEGAGKSIVEYACEVLLEHGITLKTNAPIGWDHYDLLSSWDSVCERLEYLEEERLKRNEDNSVIFEAAKLSRHYERSMKENPNFLLFEAVQFLIHCWEHVGARTCTWRFMSFTMKAAQNWSSTPEERLGFKDVCQAVFSEWNAIDVEKEENNRQKTEGAELIPYAMKDGATAIVPRGWMVINPEDAPNANYAGVIEVLNGEAFDTPHFLFFTADRNPKTLTEEERLALYQKTVSVWPKFKEVINAQVELEYGPDGGVLNQKEWVLAPAIGLFNIYDEGKYPYGKHPYGAHIKRREGGIE